MKKILGILIFFIIILPNSISAEKMAFMDFSQEEVYYNYYFNKDNFVEINDPNRITNPDITEKLINSNTKVIYKTIVASDKSMRRYGEWFKFQKGIWFNYKETYETGLKTKYEERIDTIDSSEYYYDASKVTTSAILVNNNGQGNVKNVLFQVFEGKNKSEEVLFTYSNKDKSTRATYDKLSVSFKNPFTNKFIKYFDIIAKRDGNLNITRLQKDTYDEDNGKLYERIYTTDIYKRNGLKDPNNIKVNSINILYYNYESKVEKKIFCKNYIVVREELTDYHHNNKVKTRFVTKRNLNDEVISVKKYKYNSSGKRNKYITYSYKNDKITKRKEYVFNSKGTLKGKAYRYITTYKKGKRVRTYKYLYNSRGKIYKKYRVKHRKDFDISIISEY